jgi:hypothetical protein
VSGPDVALATCREAWREDDDAAPLLEALAATGVTASLQVWDDPDVDWSAHDLVVVRSTWDYVPRRAEFLAWAERVEAVTALANPAEVLRWNTDKRYLADLAHLGVPVVPTTFLAVDDAHRDGPEGTERAIAAAAASSSGFVVKPTVSAGSKDTIRYPGGPAAEGGATGDAVRHADDLLRAGRDVMVQPYLDGVDTRGETGLVVLDGEFSHAFRKGPLLEVGGGPVNELYARESIDPRTADAAELALGELVGEVLRDLFGAPPLYARIDLLPGPDGAPLLLELELAEPSLFLAMDPGAADRTAAALARAAATA